MDNQKALIVVIFLVLLLLVGLYFFIEQTEEADPGTRTDRVEEVEDDGVQEARIILVEAQENAFSPSVIEVSQGEVVEIILENPENHNLAIPQLDLETEPVDEGDFESLLHRFTEPGEYEFICTVGDHAEQGMRGTLIVQ